MLLAADGDYRTRGFANKFAGAGTYNMFKVHVAFEAGDNERGFTVDGCFIGQFVDIAFFIDKISGNAAFLFSLGTKFGQGFIAVGFAFIVHMQ